MRSGGAVTVSGQSFRLLHAFSQSRGYQWYGEWRALFLCFGVQWSLVASGYSCIVNLTVARWVVSRCCE